MDLQKLTRVFRRPPSSDRLEFWQDGKRQWRWRVVAANNRIVSASSESFTTKGDAKRNYKRVRKALTAVTDVVEIPFTPKSKTAK